MEIKAFSATETTYRKADEKGLYLEIAPSGSKLWRFKYRFAGKEKRLALGAYPEVSLADARQARDDARKLIQEGNDPAHSRKMGKIAAKVNAGNSFQSVAEDFIQTKLVDNGKAEATVERARWYLSHPTPSLGSRPITGIEPGEPHIQVWCCNCPLQERPCDGPCRCACSSQGSPPIVKLAIQLAPHVALRPVELRMGLWSEIDWEAKVWRIPAVRTKLRRPHSVPLSRQTLTMLRDLEQHSGGFDLMLPGLRSHLRPMSENTMNATYRRLGFDGDTVTSHGLRSTA